MRTRRIFKKITSRPTSPQGPGLTSAYTAPALHLFRALLRECTYLPDPNSRRFFHSHVVSRFRAYCPRLDDGKRQRFRKTDIILERRPMLLKKARRSLKHLCCANYGHLHYLAKILAMTYGRVGPRRYELLQCLKIPDNPATTGALTDVLQQRSDPANQHVPHPSQQLIALIKSQTQRDKTVIGRRPIKQTEPRIPTKNAWGRPMPIKRVRNYKRRWYAETLDRVMPPLPQAEWEMLRRMASGETPFYGPIPRRGSSKDHSAALESYRLDPSKNRPDPRCMRRLWAKVFQQCPMMQRNPRSRSGWDITWPDLKRRVEIGLRLDAFDNSGLFYGVDENGMVQASAFG